MFEIFVDDYKAPYNAIPIGHQGENEARCLIWNLAPYIQEFGDDGVVQVKVTQPETKYVYFATNVSKVGNLAIWTVTNVDTAKHGTGMCELYYNAPDGTTLAKSDVYKTWIFPTQGDAGDAPSPYEDIIERVGDLAAEAEASSNSAAGYADAAAQSATEAGAAAQSAVEESVAELQAELDQAISGTTVDSEVINARVDADGTTYGTLKQRLDGDYTDLKSQMYQKADAIINSASGAIASFNDGADDVPVRDLVVNIEPVQSGTGDPSPDNVRPISGWTGLKVTRTAKNLFGGTLMRAGVLECVPGATDYPEDGYVQYTSGATARAGGFTQNCGLTGKFKENTSYTFIITYAKSSNVGSNMRIYYTDGTSTTIPVLTDASAKETKVVVTPSDKTVETITKTNQSSITKLYYNESGIFEGDLTADDFVPYEGQTYNVNWETEAGTVYGGQLDVTTGVLTVDKKYEVYDGSSDEIWYTYGASGFRLLKTDIDEQSDGICNIAPTTTSASSYGVLFSTANRYIYFFNSVSLWGVTTVEGLRTWLATHNIEVCYRCTVPQTYQLTPTEVKTLLKQNNIFADTGDIQNVDYVADTKTYIDNKFAELQALILENT